MFQTLLITTDIAAKTNTLDWLSKAYKYIVPMFYHSSPQDSENQDKVKIDLYYETLCQYSEALYINELARVERDLSDYIELETYPSGFSKLLGTENNITLKCHHGVEECYGNTIHACAIRYLPRMNTYVRFNACLIAGTSNNEDAKKCAEVLNLNIANIIHCANSHEALELSKYYIEKTTLVRSKLKKKFYVPYVVINGKTMDPDDRLMPSVCAAFKTPPHKCHGHFELD